MQVVILCGGQGTRAYPYTKTVPKALMEIDGLPIVEQVMRIYASQGFTDFILSCGYLKEDISNYFSAGRWDWNIRCVDTGEESDTGDRIYNLRRLLDGPFHATYCDGLGDVDLRAVQAFHDAHGALGTITVAPLRSQYGLVYADHTSKIERFEEKPILPDYWLSGGFFVFNERVFDYWQGHNLERDVLPALAEKGELYMYRHAGFWRSMDTYKDQQELNQLWAPFSARLAQTPLFAGSTGGN